MPKAAPKTTQPTEDIGELKQVGQEVVVAEIVTDPMDDLFVSYEETEEYLNVLYWGREGSGKTIDLVDATKHGRVLLVNAEGGLKKRALLANGVNTANLVVYPRPGQEITWESFQALIFRIKSDLMDDPKSWFLIGVDSLTELNQAFIDTAGDERFARDKRKNQAWKPGLSDEFFTDRGDYGVSTKVLRKAIRMLRDLPVHVAMTALERRDVDEDTSKVAYGPALNGALQTSVLGYVDLVLYCKAADEERPYFRAQTKAVGKARAKDRIGIYPKVLVNPTFSRVLAYNEGTIVEETDPDQAILAASADETQGTGGKKPGRTSGPGVRKTPAKSTVAKGKATEGTGEADAGASEGDEG